MKANLFPCLLCVLSVCFALGFTAASAQDAAGGQDSATPQTTPPARSNIDVENWTKPVSGWLYVLDPKPDGGGPGGRVWLIDPESGKAMGSIRTGDHADFALSPDGSRLYVASATEGDSSELAVIDTVQGVVLKDGGVGGRAMTDGLPPFSTMAVSGDGLALRILIDAPKSADADALLLATFDTQAGEFLPGIVHLGNCGPGRFISYPAADHFDFLCPRTNRVRLIRVDADSRELQNFDVGLPWERRIGVAEAIEVPGDPDIAIVRGDGGIFKMNVATHDFADTMAHPVLPNRVPPAAWPTSPDGSRLYVGYHKDYERYSDNRFYLDYGRPPNVRPNAATASEFHVLDTHTWRKIGTIRTKMLFWSAVTGNDGKMLYATVPQKHSILVIDTAKMREMRILKVGGMPTLALVAP
ncbi:MAG: YncE family protein [Candidatus Sulfotelmatobacter sp.]